MNTKHQTVRKFSGDTDSKHMLTKLLVSVCLLLVSLEALIEWNSMCIYNGNPQLVMGRGNSRVNSH